MASVRGRGTQLRLWVAFLAGCAVGGALTGTALGVLSGLLSPLGQPVRWGLFAAVALMLVALDLRQPRLRLPQRR